MMKTKGREKIMTLQVMGVNSHFDAYFEAVYHILKLSFVRKLIITSLYKPSLEYRCFCEFNGL